MTNLAKKVFFCFLLSLLALQDVAANVDPFASLYRLLNGFNESIPDARQIFGEYDFIIIGSGSAGSVLANRLSANETWSVLLLEVGGEENILTDVPLSVGITSSTKFNWGYRTDPTPNACLRLRNGVCSWVRGRAIGGSSVINYMLYSRGHRQDYDDWAAAGNQGWSYADVLPFFKKSEITDIPELQNSEYHGTDGLLSVQRPRFETQLLRRFISAGKQLGYREIDVNGATQMGFSQVQATLRDGKRCSAGKAFVRPAMRRKNLHISMGSWVTKLIIDPVTKTATGVEFVKNKRRYVVKASKEVILSGGSIGSPQLLMLSGIGPQDHLNELGIPVIQNLKVGYNLQDHMSFPGMTFLMNQNIALTLPDVSSIGSILNFTTNGNGPITLPGGTEGYAFLHSDGSMDDNISPDLEIVSAASAYNEDPFGVTRIGFGFTDEFYQVTYSAIYGRSAFMLVPVNLRPKSRGRISLKSTNPFHWPRLDPGYFDDSRDIDVLIKGIRIVMKLTETEAYKEIGAKIHRTPYPGCENHEFDSDAYWTCCIRGYSVNFQHMSGTCKMGPARDPDAVVSPTLEVHGIKRLRVADSSIFPTIPSSHTNSVAIMVGEKAADMIIRFWENGNSKDL